MGKNKLLFDKYYNGPTNVYYIVDKEFLQGFNDNQAVFMLYTYYRFYEKYCKQIGMKPSAMDKFLINARRKKVKIIQLCCPYCGQIDIMVTSQSVSRCDSMNYCVTRGKKSTNQIIFEQVASFIRMNTVHQAGLGVMKGKHETSYEILGYDVWLTEIIQLTSILEATLREFYIDLVSMKYRCYEDEFLTSIIKKEIKNDFLNIDKANEHYRKALNIDLRILISQKTRENLLDLVNVRNSAVHNNGKLDDKFKKTHTYNRLKEHISGDLIFIDSTLIEQYLGDVLELVNGISIIYEKRFFEEKYLMISNYYFNLKENMETMVLKPIAFKCKRDEEKCSFEIEK